MKIRQSFVSNSSSCSFVILRRYLNDDQVDKLLNIYDYDKSYDDSWFVSEGEDGSVTLWTSMDTNWDMIEYITDFVGVARKHIEEGY